MDSFLRQQHQKAEQQGEQHIELHKARNAIFRESQLVGQLCQYSKPQQPPGVFAFGAGVTVPLDEEIAHCHGGKIANVKAQIGIPHPGGQKHIGNVVDKHGEHGNIFDGIAGHGENSFFQVSHLLYLRYTLGAILQSS